MTDQPLSPAAQAIMVAATNGNFNVVNDPVYKQCIAAALRVAADRLTDATSSHTLYAIADELEGVKYGTYRCNLEKK